MTKAYVNFAINNTNNPGAPWDNEFFGPGTYDTIGVLTADLIDDAGASTGWGLEVTDVFDNDSGSTGNATADAVWPQQIFDYYWQTENGGTGAFLLTGLPAGNSYTVELAGHNLSAGRDTQFTVNGVNADYTTSANAAAPNAPIVFNGTVPGNGELAISVTLAATGQFYGYVNGLTIETTAGTGLTIDQEPSETRSDTAFQFQVSTPATAPTLANTTVGFTGETPVTPDSISGSDPYTITATFPRSTPLLYSETGYTIEINVDVETATSSAIDWLPIAGRTFINLVTPDNGAGTFGDGYSGSPYANGDQNEYSINLTPQSTITLDSDPQNYWILSTTPTQTNTATFGRRAADGTADAIDTITFQVGDTPTSNIKILINPLKSPLSDILEEPTG